MNKRVLALSPLAMLISLSLPSRAVADFLSPADQTFEAMTGNQEENLSALLAIYGPFASPLNFNMQMNLANMTYDESLAPGTTYNGLPLQLSMHGSFDSTSGLWTSVTSGAIGLTPLFGVATYAFSDPPGVANETSDYHIAVTDKDGKVHNLHVEDTRKFVEDPIDPLLLFSIDTYKTTDETDGGISTEFGHDSRQITLDELIGQYDLPGNFDPANPNRVFPVLLGQGSVNSTTGAGSFSVSESPEPATWTLLTVALFACGLAKRRNPHR